MSLKIAYDIIEHIYKLSQQDPCVITINTHRCIDSPICGSNGEYCTKQGLILEMYYGNPSYIRTPYGTITGWWSFVTNGPHYEDKLMENLKDDLGLILVKNGIQTQYGYCGPYYSITKFKDLVIPEFIGYKTMRPNDKELSNAIETFNNTMPRYFIPNYNNHS